MPLFRMTADALLPVESTTFAAESVRERQDLQRLLRKHLDLLGEDLLFVAEEYGSFQDSRRRIDLLALDRTGQMVVVELKRTDDGGHMELQALRYAAMVSTMTFDQLVATFADHNGVDEAVARQRISDWLSAGDGGDDDEVPDTLDNRVRIILVAADFSTEITSTVLWLSEYYRVDIRCYRLVPYRLGGEVLIDLQQLIPLPEAADFQIRQRDKELESAAAKVRATTKDFTKYDLTIAGERTPGLSKQAAVLHTVRRLMAHGVAGSEIRAVLIPRRWLSVQRQDGEGMQGAFQRQYPERGSGYWIDLGMVDADGEWVMPTLGGRKTEVYLSVLATLGGDRVPVHWEHAHDRRSPLLSRCPPRR